MKTTLDRRGVVLVWFVLFGIVLIGFIGLTCDVLYAYFVGQNLQHAADAGALGGGQKINVNSLDEARLWAKFAASCNEAAKQPVQIDLNEANSPAGHIVIGRWHRLTRTFTPIEVGTLSQPGANAIKVTAPRPDLSAGRVSLLFGPIFGINSISMSRSAVAMNIGGTGGAILLLNEHDPRALRMTGTSELNVTNGAIQVNSDHQYALSTVGDPSISVSDINVVSTTSQVGRTTSFNGNVNNGADVMEDPLAWLADHIPVKGDSLKLPSGSEVTINPGYYPKGIKWANGTLRLNPGVYIFEGEGFQVTGGNIYANEVLLFLTGKDKKTLLNLRGNGEIEISPMTTDPYKGVSIFQDYGLDNDATIEGTDQMRVSGTLYFPSAKFLATGTGDAFGNQIIADTMDVYGTSSISIDYNGQWAPAGKVFLVD